MDYILHSLACAIPCIAPALSVVGFVITFGIIRNRMIYRGPMPSDGPVEGFASKAARIEYFSTNDQRFREMVKWAIIWAVIALVSSGVVMFFNTYSINIR